MIRIKISFYIRRSRKLQDGNCPIYCRLTMNGQRAEFAVNKSIKEDLWIPKAGRAFGNSVEAFRINKHLEGIIEGINKILRQFELKNISCTPELVRNEFLGINKQQKFLIEAYELHNKKMSALVGKEYATKTLARHKTSLKHVKDFIRAVYRSSDIELNKVSYQFLKDYEFWLKTNTSCQHNAVVKYINNLGKIIREAIKRGWMEHDPFKNAIFKYEEVDKPFLSQSELDKLLAKKFAIPRLEKVRDVFIFCCFTGLAFIDVKELIEKDFMTGVDNSLWIRKKRQKTKNWSNIPVLPIAQEILEKYKTDPECEISGTLLPVPSNQKMNAYLKEITELTGINMKLTTHVARHTFATTVTLSNGVSIEAVSKMLGHTSIDMTKRYARILDNYIANEMAKIKNLY
ncbi:site-specific integrase [uncultured Draconibacterium sp.]|uniref:site-specific integrase n=1 Tax=uncultured Draconibacterium sp. TaxID=1573823 RepID=UPI002AA74B1E|nr:site-specific integrase [uncultured Draconibacterium sp.]